MKNISNKMLSKSLRKLCFNKNIRISAVAPKIQKRNNSSNTEQNVIRSKIRDINIPHVLLDEFMWKGLDKYHDRTILECAETGRSYTYAEIYKKSRALANFFHKYDGLTEGDTVAVILPNVPEYPIILLGIVQAGLKITPVNPAYTHDEIAKQLKDSQAKMIFTLNGLLSKTEQAVQTLPNKKIPVVAVENGNNQPTSPGVIKFKELVEGNHDLSFRVTRTFDDVIVIPYSSGTTGLPKGVELTNKNIVSNLIQIDVDQFAYMFGDTDNQDVIPAILPMFHIYGMVPLMLAMLSRGCKLVTMAKFDPQIFINVLENHKPTVGFLVPPLVLLLINHPLIKQEHLSHMRAILSGAAPLGASDIERLNEKFKKDIYVTQGYGLTETSPVVLAQTPAVENGIKLGGSGMLVPNTECKIASLDDANRTLGPNQPGELLVRGPQVMKGYLNNKKATDEVLDADGWFRTGDIGYYDEDEHFFITDRLKELIKVKGFQVAPAELEEVLRDHPDVEDAAVAGIPHPEFGEAPKAFIVPRKGATIDSTELHKYVASKVAKHKHLVGGIVIIDSIPKTASGKLMRRALKEMK